MNRSIIILSYLLFTAAMSCSDDKRENFSGTYRFEVEGFKNASSAEMEIIDDADSYFGRITFNSPKPRVFEIGLKSLTKDSLIFRMPGDNGFLRLGRTSDLWSGKFKYFGLEGNLNGTNIGAVSEELNSLKDLSPISPGLISTVQEESFPSIDPITGDLYFSRNGKNWIATKESDGWVNPEEINQFQESVNSAIRFSPDGKSAVFTSNKALPGSEKKKKNLWISQRNSEGWNEPEPLPNPVNIDSIGDYHASISGNGNIYFVSYNRPGGFGRSDIYKASLLPDRSYQVKNLGASINTESSEADVYVDSDERFIIYCATDYNEGYGADDLYVSYQINGRWSEPENLGPRINSFAYEYGPWIDWEGEWFYFNSYRRGSSDIYRIKLSELNLKFN